MKNNRVTVRTSAKTWCFCHSLITQNWSSRTTVK